MLDVVLGTEDKMMHEKGAFIALGGLADWQNTSRYIRNSVIRSSDQTSLPEKHQTRLGLRNQCELARIEVEGAGRRKRMECETGGEDSMGTGLLVRGNRTHSGNQMVWLEYRV